MKQYKILIISDSNKPTVIEDLLLAKAFREDGHLVKVGGMEFDPKYDKIVDIMLRRNSWGENKRENTYYKVRNDMFLTRVYARELTPINVKGFQDTKYEYLVELTDRKDPNVIPTIYDDLEIEKILRLNNTEDFVLRDIEQYIDTERPPISLKKNKIQELYVPGQHLIQAHMKYKSEIQFHFVGNKLMYAFEYKPTKYSKFTNEKLITKINDKDREVVERIVNLSNIKYGFQRLDFIRLPNDELKLLEIKDTYFKMHFDKMDQWTRGKIISEYKRNIYEFLELDYDERMTNVFYRDIYGLE